MNGQFNWYLKNSRGWLIVNPDNLQPSPMGTCLGWKEPLISDTPLAATPFSVESQAVACAQLTVIQSRYIHWIEVVKVITI